jgi:hypothetical protein
LKEILLYIKDFVRKDYSFSTYLTVFIFLFLSIALNYYFDIENGIINEQESRILRFFLYLILYNTAYYGTLLIFYCIENVNYFSDKKVMAISSIAILLLSFDGALVVTGETIQSYSNLNADEAKYLKKIINQSFPTIIYLGGIIFIKYKYPSGTETLYGFSIKGFHWKPYIIMLLGMVPLIAWASFQQSFTELYPFFKFWNYAPVFGWSQKQLFSFYEFFYLLNFLNVELLFRGLLIIGMIRYMDHKAVLPMIVLYAFLHFGKPTAETISSVLGGYILGAIAYQTKNIFGGFVIHVCIAFLMDLFALLQLNGK